MALTAEEQKLYDFAKGMLPSWVKEPDEFLHGAAKLFGSVRALIDYLFGQTLITQAVGATATTPDWLNQHARDRGTSRQDGEGDVALRERLRTIPDALTRAAVLAAANAILVAEGGSANAVMLELPRDGAHFSSYVAMSGVGGAFTKAGSVVTFAPTTLPWPTPPWQHASVAPERRHQIVLATCEDAGNNGTFTITGLNGDGVQYTNAGGVVNAADTTVAWTVKRMDGSNNITDGFRRSYLGRGYRMASERPPRFIVILPFGTSASAEVSVREALRIKKAAGYLAIVERRLIA